MNKKILLEKLTNIYFFVFPVIFMRYYYYKIDKFIMQNLKKIDKKGKVLIDIGAGDCPIKRHVKNLSYISLDIKQNKNNTIDIVYDVNDGLPILKNNTIDYILCTQVLEHLKKPHIVFSEFSRVLKPGGKIFLTTNFCYEEHMIPYDYFRFTKYGLKYLGESNGLVVKHLAPQGGIFQTFSLTGNTILIKLFAKEQSLAYYLMILIFSIPMLMFNIICYLLDFLDTDKRMSVNYECVYVKPRK